MHDLEELLNRAILEAGAHCGRAMLLLDHFRHSSDPQMVEAYRLVHDLMSDLGAVRTCAQLVISYEAGPDAAIPLGLAVETPFFVSAAAARA